MGSKKQKTIKVLLVALLTLLFVPHTARAATTVTWDSSYTGGPATFSEDTILNVVADVTIDVSGTPNTPAILVNNSSTLTLNIAPGATLMLKGGENCAALQVGTGNTLIVNGPGTLEATGGNPAAGIGGGNEADGGTVMINGGTVTAVGDYGAGIGGGQGGAGGTVTINGGAVTATGGRYSAGIGGGYQGAGGTVTINGGTVTTTGGDSAGAGIGGGNFKAGDTITINGGTVTAAGGYSGAAGIGGGNEADGGTITINVPALGSLGGDGYEGYSGGAGIGGGGGTIRAGGAAGVISSLYDLSALKGTAIKGGAGGSYLVGGGKNDGADIGSGGSGDYGGSAARGVETTPTQAAIPTSPTDLTALMWGGHQATISGNTATLILPAGTDISALAPTFILSPGARAEVGSAVQTSGVSTQDFTGGSITYTIYGYNEATGEQTVTDTFEVIVLVLPQIDPQTFPAIELGESFEATLTASSDPTAWILVPGAPSWLSIDDNGHLTGTPTEAGTFTFSVIAINEAGESEPQEFELIVTEEPSPEPTSTPTTTTPVTPPSQTTPTGDMIPYVFITAILLGLTYATYRWRKRLGQ